MTASAHIHAPTASADSSLVTSADVDTRDIISIDEMLCNGCGVCLPSCAEGALALENGKVKIIADKLCDGLGACLGVCPRGALQVIRRKAVPFDETAVQHHIGPKICPSLAESAEPIVSHGLPEEHVSTSSDTVERTNTSRHWPLKLQLTPVDKAFLKDARLLLAADCAPAACPAFATRYLPGKTMLITCPKLEDKQAIVDKLAALFSTNPPRDITLARMEVPCCCLPDLVRKAQEAAGTNISVSTVVLTRYGQENLPGFGPKSCT